MGLNNVYKQLEIDTTNGLYIAVDKNIYKNILPKRLFFLMTEKLVELGLKSFFCFDNKPLILFYDSPSNKEAIFKQIWNFNESPIVIINEPNNIEIYNGFSYLKNEKTLEKLTTSERLTDFSYFKLVTGKSLKDYRSELKKEKKVDRFLLKNIESARKILIETHQLTATLANALIGKCILARYLIDREVALKFKIEIKTNDDFCTLFDNKQGLISFFEYIQAQFNGEAFLLDDNELNSTSQGAFNTVKDLFSGVEISSGQQSLFDVYDFSIIPVEFISNVYERFIGEVQQKGSGAFYTPKFLVDYMLAETVEKQGGYNCKVLDPACGSGIFLVEALRRIVEKYLDLNNQKITSKKLKQLVEGNIYGIDKDESAINVAIFSIYLALLDYQNPRDIETFKFPNLKENGNFYCNDFFDTNATYNQKFKEIAFDFIIGNPPWKRGGGNNGLFDKYIKNNPKFKISNKEIAQGFLSRSRDFSVQNTQCALVITSKVLYNLQTKSFRKYFLEKNFIHQVLELAPVAKEVFDSTNAPAAVLFFEYAHEEDTSSNLIKHLCLKPNRLFSLFKIFTLRKPDIKTIVQKKLIEYDWLWKVLVYGNYLDFNLLNRVNEKYETIEQKVNRDDNLRKGQGVIIGKNDKRYSVDDWVGRLRVDHKQDMERYRVKASSRWSENKVTEKREDDLFKSPFLLVKHALDRNMQSISAISYTDALYQHSVTGIIGNTSSLRLLCGLLNSLFFTYYAINNSIANIDKGRVHDRERFNFPYIENKKISAIVKEIEEKSEQIYGNTLTDPILIRSKENLIKKLNNEVFKSFALSKQEQDLVDYAINVNMPLIKNRTGYEYIFASIDFKNKLLEGYIQIFFSRFEGSFGEGKHLKVNIWHTDFLLGLFFEVTPDNDELINWSGKENLNFLTKISSLGITEVAKNLFIQKDIRGFEEEGFYIIKPNEKNLWHKAMAHVDADEFMDAILKAKT